MVANSHIHILYLTTNLAEAAPIVQSIARAGYAADAEHLCPQRMIDIALSSPALLVFDLPVLGIEEEACLQQILADDFTQLVIVLLAEFKAQAVANAYRLGASHVIAKDRDGDYLIFLPTIIDKALTLAQTFADLRQYNQDLLAQIADLDAYADTVAHDLKNPITHFLSYADDMRENHTRMAPAEIESYLEIIVQQSRKMNSIVEDLLLLARTRLLEKLETADLDMATIVTNALTRVQGEGEWPQATIQLPDSWPVAVGHAPWVEGVWVNYLSNGLKYGGTPPCLTLGADTAADGMVRYWVTDNGLGLIEAEQQLLFKPFPKLDHRIKKGHGLGLTIVRRIIERLGGQVGVESQLGAGSTFYFTLPSEEANTA